MGRELRRVPLDFTWPIHKIWPGFLMRDYDSDEEDLRKFAEIKGLKLSKYNGPIIPAHDLPVGEGYQMWETTSEGSPISPVFKTPEELAQWLSDTGASAFGDMTATYEQWLATIKGSGYSVGLEVDADGIKHTVGRKEGASEA